MAPGVREAAKSSFCFDPFPEFTFALKFMQSAGFVSVELF